MSAQVMTGDEYEAETVRLALHGDPDDPEAGHRAGREALRLCRAGLDHGNLSRRLTAYLAERLWLIDQALDEADKLRSVKKSSGSIRSARDAAIAEALCIKRPAKKPSDPLPEWQVPYAALGMLLLKAGIKPERVKGAMDEARRQIEKKDEGLHRREAEKILKDYLPMRNLDDDLLLHLAGPLRGIVPTFLPQAKKP